MEITLNKSMFKKTLALIMAFLIVMSSMWLGFSFASLAMEKSELNVTGGNVPTCKIIESGICGENVKYDLYENRTVVVYGEGRMYNYKGWSESPFYSKGIKKIIVTEGVTRIGSDSFSNCDELVSVCLPEGLECIGESAFLFCDKLERVNIPYGITKIEDWTFAFCHMLLSVSIPNSVVDIGSFAFGSCDNLNNVYYYGLESQWRLINIGFGNDGLEIAKINFINCSHENKLNCKKQNPTCSDKGYTSGMYCLDCEIWLSGHEEIPALGHSFVSYDCDNNATCTADETKTAKCERCDETDTITVKNSKLPHMWGEWKDIIAPTCTENGKKQRMCSNCTAIESRTVKPTDHKNKYTVEKTDATCTEVGYTTGTYCPDCATWLLGHEDILKIPHSFTKYSSDKNATLTADGTKTAYCDYGCGASDKVSDKGSKLILSKPSDLTTTQNTSSIKLAWKAAENATGYRIYYKLSGDVSWKQCVSYTISTTHTFKNLPAGQSYYFAVRSAGNTENGKIILGPYVEIATATEAVVPAKIDSLQNSSTIRLNWTACRGATGYRIYYKLDDKWKVAVKATTATSHTFKNLKAGSKFTFAVRPYILTDNGVVWSNYTIITTSTKTTAPVLKVSNAPLGRINLSWKAVSGAEFYQVYYKVGNENYKLYKNYSSVQNLKFSNLKSGTKYTFAVRGVIKGSEDYVYGSYNPVTVTVK